MQFTQQVQTYIEELGYDFTPDFTHPKQKWVSVNDDKLKGSYVFDVHVLKDKSEVLVFTIYDFRKSMSYTEKFAGRDLTKGELSNVNEKIEKQKAEAEETKKQKWEECKAYCEKEWSSANPTTSHTYLTRKGFPYVQETVGLKVRTNLIGKSDLLVPTYDIEGAFWGYQSIHESGEKQFAIGQRMDSVFFPIVNGVTAYSRIYLAEGLATGLTIAEAIEYKYVVVVAFNAGNMIKVAREMRRKYGRAPIVVCADNDKWKPGIGNTGLRVAEQIVSTIDGATCALPDFSGCDETTKPTDFNDLQNLSGIAEVKKQINSVRPNRPHTLYSLGYNNNTHYFTTSENPQIQTIQEFTTTDFLKLRPLSYWEINYANLKGIIDWTRAKNDVMRDSYAKGQFEPGKIRGRGIWLEKEKLAIHLGNKLYFENGYETDLSEIESENIYDPRTKTELPEKKLFGPGDLEAAEKIISRFSWENEFDKNLFMGWIVCAPLSGMIDWRPHLCLTAQAGSGKTTLITHVVEPALRKFGPFKVENTTEAGLRQSIRTDAIPIFLDEFDTNSLNERQFHSIMSLLRASSSEGGTVRGTTGGKALKFNAKFSALLAGVNLPNFNEADRTRITQIGVTKHHKETDWQKFKLEIVTVFNPDFSTKFFWHVFSVAKNFKTSAEIISSCIQTIADARTGQQYGALLAGYWHFKNSEVIGMGEAKKLVEAFGKWGEIKIESGDLGESDSNECFDHLMNLIVKTETDRQQVTLGDFIASDESVDVKNKFLNAYGLKLFVNEGLFISSNNPNLKKHFKDTVWARWNMALKRIDKAKPTSKKLAGISVRGYLLNVDVPGDDF